MHNWSRLLLLVAISALGMLITTPGMAEPQYDEPATSPAQAGESMQERPDGSPSSETKLPIMEEEAMTLDKLHAIISRLAGDTVEQGPIVQFMYNEVPMSLISSVEMNRMRIVAEVISADQLTQEHFYSMMISNYHLALDARYALGGDTLYSVYIHPLQELTVAQVESALRQVSTLTKTFGKEYSSGELSFAIQQRGQEI